MMIIVVMMEPPSPTCPGSSSSLASSSWSRTGSSAEGSQSDFLPTFFLFQVFLSANQFSLPDECEPPSLGDQRLGQLPHLLQLRHQVGEAPILSSRTISSKVRPVSGSKPAWGTLSQARRKARGAISWGESLGFQICIVFLVIFFATISFSIICLCFTKETEGQNAHNWAKCSWQLWVWTCLFLFEKNFVRSFCTVLSPSWISMTTLEIALKCDCKMLGWRLTRPHEGKTLQYPTDVDI